ncbi:hypothetical protein GEOBRER4_n1271 [Citrifermentans bremense]|uniref:Uncharacterized protein n=1 Tax=Citrifermentans bremense TaxID=60035 RepID=A0A6S6M475_9BACT|nr:hypothetical protein [Citrifermentans bremense]BCG46474.1 hypothetical protein GEOBRER4_n1271 [Citrifermentans bremense]
MSQGILRNYRNVPPTKFHSFNQKVATALADKTRIPDSTWAANPSLLQSYLAVSAKHDAVYHESMLGSKLVIAEREVLQSQLVIYLDEIALILEMAAVHTPDILIASGFESVKDRRLHNRGRAVPATPEAPNATPAEHGEGGDGTAT